MYTISSGEISIGNLVTIAPYTFEDGETYHDPNVYCVTGFVERRPDVLSWAHLVSLSNGKPCTEYVANLRKL